MMTFGVVDGDRARRGQTATILPGANAGAYREVRPPGRLAAHIECFWRRAAGVTPTTAPILPDGCIDIIWATGHEPFVVGPATLPVRTTIDFGAEVCGVRFRPGTGRRILGVDAHELLDRLAPLRDIWPRGQTAAWEEAAERPSLIEKLDAVAALVTDRLASGADPDSLVRDAVARIVACPHARIEEIARGCGLSDRQMRRRFAQSVGYGPKTLQRVLRMQRVLWLAHTDAAVAPGLALLAFAAGYADQPHMTREVAELAGLTPRQLLLDSRRGSAVSELFKTTVGHDATMVCE